MEERDETKVISISEDVGESTYAHIPSNRPIITMNDALARLVKVGKLIKFSIDTPEDIAIATCIIRPVDMPVGGQYQTYKGQGKSLNEALKQMLDRVDADNPIPPAA